MKLLAAALYLVGVGSAFAGPPVYVPSSGGDDAPAINAALISNCSVVLGSEVYHQASIITVPANCVIEGRGRSSRIVKTANTDMIDLKYGGELHGLTLDGDGANFTGRGVVIRADQHYQRIYNTHISSAGYCIDFEAPGAGTHAKVEDGFITRYPNLQAYSIKLPDSDPLAGGNRILRDIRSSGGYGVDLAGANNTMLDRANMAMIHMNSGLRTAQITNSRFGGPIEWRGSGLWVSFNNISNGSYVTSETFQSLFLMTISNAPVGRQDPAGNGNTVW